MTPEQQRQEELSRATNHGNKIPTKFYTDCQSEHSASLECSITNYENKHVVCQPFFDAYKECRREEQKRRRDEMLKKMGWR